MAVQTSYPGVYIDEFAPGAPIQGVGTNTAAFIGAAERGPLDEPTRLTTWDQFRAQFGESPLTGFYLWHAVRGFFENGGQVCYVVRASNGTYDTLDINNRAGVATATVRSELPSTGNPASISIALTNVITGAVVFQPAAVAVANAVSLQELQLNSVGEAAQFRPGDVVTEVSGTARATVARISQDTMFLTEPLTGADAAGAAIAMADIPAGSRVFRLDPAGTAIPTIISASGLSVSALTAGTILTLDQGGGASTDTVVVQSVQTENFDDGSGPQQTFRITLREGLRSAFVMDGTAVNINSEEFEFLVSDGVAITHANLGFDPDHPRYYVDLINTDADVPVRILPMDPPPPASLLDGLLDVTALGALTAGVAEDLTTLASIDYTQALDTLASVDDVNLIAAPDAAAGVANVDRDTVHQAIIAHCETLADRFAVLDSGLDRTPSGQTSIEIQRAALDSSRGYGALYFPWLRVPPPVSGPPILVPPSGHVCGVIARSDATKGVHKAPANEIINGALGVQHTLSDIEQGILNLQGINVLRVFSQGGRPVVWGARTTATDTNWQYVSVRRLFLFLEESIEEGIRWAVFEPNNLALWQKLRRTIRAFLMTQWRAGALFGETPDDAFYVRIDEVLNPFSEQQLGRLHMEIGVRPAYPAEFIVVRIGIWDGGAEITEG